MIRTVLLCSTPQEHARDKFLARRRDANKRWYRKYRAHILAKRAAAYRANPTLYKMRVTQYKKRNATAPLSS